MGHLYIPKNAGLINSGATAMDFSFGDVQDKRRLIYLDDPTYCLFEGPR